MAPGYISIEIRRQVRTDANARCGYCHTPEVLVGMPLEFEHIYPEALGGLSVRTNLWLACTRYNDFKNNRIHGRDPDTDTLAPLYNPREQHWLDHFTWSANGTHIVGLTAVGRATIEALRLNNDFIIVTRQFWVASGWWPPSEDVQR